MNKSGIYFTLPIRTVSLANQREHWATRAKRAKSERHTTCLCMPHGVAHMHPPLTVTLTRIAPRTLDTDNLAGSFKSVRDAIADRLGIDDGDPRISWHYAQEKHGKTYSVKVGIERA